VRVIQYTVHTTAAGGTEESSEVFCLVTSLLDVEYQAPELACCYPRWWGCETAIGHHDMGEGQPVLRSSAPEGMMHGTWALLLVYQAIRKIVGIAVDAAGHPPAKISLPHALAAATDTIAASPRPRRPRPRHVPGQDPHARLSSPATGRTGPASARPRGRRLPSPESRRAQRCLRHPPDRFQLLYPWQIT
jgi:hypothetical protein